MREVRSVITGDRRVSLWCDEQYWYSVRLEVWAEGCWQDISRQSDASLGITAAHRRYAECVMMAQLRSADIAPSIHSLE
jgi:hypothetical protein